VRSRRRAGFGDRLTRFGFAAPVLTGDRAIVVHVSQSAAEDTDAALGELRELARTAGVRIVDEIVQRKSPPDPRFVVGRGKLGELMLQAMHRDAELVIFNRDLTPTQARSIADTTELKVIDRTQLILDIFAQRATTRAGKRRVELAQLKYSLPRMDEMKTAMSRLTGGIGGRGPGETKLELNRRLAKRRIRQLEREIEQLRGERDRRRRLRDRRGLPVIGIVGYTNAGKSTLLNALTGSHVLAEDKLFATLDPTSRRLRFPTDREVILSDTVGFIRDLPPDLVSAFLATLEELQSADVLVHVVDASSPFAEEHIEAVGRILDELDLARVPRVVAFNKVDRLRDLARLHGLTHTHDGLPVCALDRETLRPLLSRIEAILWPANGAHEDEDGELRYEPPRERALGGGVVTERI
jgi:GTP-binding protein HflX